MGRAYYNEIDRDAAHVLRCLIADGLIAPGAVDDRSIKDIRPDDLAGYTQVHLFAGAGLWSVAARLAGWADDRPLWSASCPCQPFSAAGKGLGVDDPRHLWPDVDRLVHGARERGFGPPVLVGEQVAGAPGYHWFNGVRADLAVQGYRARVVDIPACAVDAPNIRQRLYWCALADADARGRAGRQEASQRGEVERAADERAAGRPLEHAACIGRGKGRPQHELRSGRSASAGAVASGDLAQPERSRREGRNAQWPWPSAVDASDRPNGSAWAGSDWIVCHDGKARRTEPGLRLLVDGMAGRVPAWRLGGNSINPVLAAQAIISLREVLDVRKAAPSLPKAEG